MVIKNRCLIAAYFFFLAGTTFSQVAPQNDPLKELNGDLSDETEETTLLDKGEIQFEFAYLHTAFISGIQPSIFQGLIKYGLFKRLELRLLIEEGYGRDKYIEETVQSTAPLAVSTKISLLKKHPILPDITLVAYLKLPFTSRTSEQLPYWSPNVSLAFQHKFGDKWKLEYNAGMQQEAYSTDWGEFANASLHFKVTDKAEVFAQYYGQYQSGEDPQHNAGGGLFYQFNNNVGVYCAAGSSILYATCSYCGSLGVVMRLQK